MKSEIDIARRSAWNATKGLMTIMGSGKVGIGTTEPQAKLHVAGSILAASCDCTSDIRLKQAIRPIENALDRLLSLTGVWFRFDRESHPDMNLPEGRQMGLIAQEVEQVAPELVMTPEGDGFKAIKYGNAVALVIEAMKEQQAEIERLREDNGLLRERIAHLERVEHKHDELERRLAALEDR